MRVPPKATLSSWVPRQIASRAACVARCIDESELQVIGPPVHPVDAWMPGAPVQRGIHVPSPEHQHPVDRLDVHQLHGMLLKTGSRGVKQQCPAACGFDARHGQGREPADIGTVCRVVGRRMEGSRQGNQRERFGHGKSLPLRTGGRLLVFAEPVPEQGNVQGGARLGVLEADAQLVLEFFQPCIERGPAQEPSAGQCRLVAPVLEVELEQFKGRGVQRVKDPRQLRLGKGLRTRTSPCVSASNPRRRTSVKR